MDQISDLYNVPFDSDVYAVPVDVVKPPVKPKRAQQLKKRRRNTACGCRDLEVRQCRYMSSKKNYRLDKVINIHIGQHLKLYNSGMHYIGICKT